MGKEEYASRILKYLKSQELSEEELQALHKLISGDIKEEGAVT